MKGNTGKIRAEIQYPQELLLKTKLSIPSHPRAEYVSRLRLLEQCEQMAHKKLTTCIAPAGYGKTSMVSEWVVRSKQSVAWVSLDRSDNNPVRFWTHFIASLSFVEDPKKQWAMEKLLQPELEMEAVLTLLLNAIYACSENFTLVLDDFHTIRNPEIHRGLAFLIEHQPPGMHMFLISRTQPELPLARLRARNQLLEIHAADLRFTIDEIMAYLQQATKWRLSPCDVKALAERTEGWITGVRFLVHSLKCASPTRAKEGREWKLNRHITDYFEDEVWANLSNDHQQFLLCASILETLTPPTCQVLTERRDSQAVLEHLYQEGMFVNAVDDEQAEYCFHPLFRDYLRHKLQREDAKRRKELHQKMVGWYEKRQAKSKMMEHAVAAADFDRAADLVKRYARSLMRECQIATLQDWLSELPSSLLLTEPKLGLIQTWVHLVKGDPNRAWEWLQTVERQEAFCELKQKDGSIQEEYVVLRMILQLMTEGGAATIKKVQELWEALPFGHKFYPHFSFAIGESLKQVHRLEEAEKFMKAASESAERQGDGFIAAWAEALLAEIEMARGLLREAMARLNRALKRAKTPCGKLPVAGLLYLLRGMIHYEWDQLDEAERNMANAYDLCRQWNNQSVLVDTYIWKARVIFAKQKDVVAKELLKRAEDLIEDEGIFPQGSSKVRAVQALLAILQEKSAKALTWAEENQLSLSEPYPAHREWEAKTRVRVLILEKDEQKTISVIDRWAEHAEQTGRKKELAEFLILKAMAHMAFGQVMKAFEAIEKALVIGSELHLVRTFLDEGPSMASLLLQVANAMEKGCLKISDQVKKEYVSCLLGLFKKHAITPAWNRDEKKVEEQPDWMIEPLSDREKQVLQLVAEGLTNQEIADQLVISLSTVKKHINNIYGKLQVRNRTQAINYARKLQFLNA